MDEYLDRAEKLKTHIAKAENKKPGLVGSNGKVSAGGGKYVSFDWEGVYTAELTTAHVEMRTVTIQKSRNCVRAYLVSILYRD